MPFIEFFRCNVRHAGVLVILFSFFPLDNPIFSIHLSTFRDHSYGMVITYKHIKGNKKMHLA